MRHYRQLTPVERYQIEALLDLEVGPRQIGEHLGRSPSTISREILRNSQAGRYDGGEAQRRTGHRRQCARKFDKRQPALLAKVAELLREDWSPEQIAGWLTSQGYPLVSHEWIYRYVADDQRQGGDLYLHLRHKRKRYRKRYGSQDRRGQIVNRVGIEARPAVVDERRRLGDWEGDTMVGKGCAALVTLVDRCSGYLEVRKLERATAANTASAIGQALSVWPDKAITLTVDNGKEFAHHEQVAKALSAVVYFADPYSSWQRGTNENTNGLIRQYFPKGTDFHQVTEVEIQDVVKRINCRPRKRLGYLTPFEVFHQCRFDTAA